MSRLLFVVTAGFLVFTLSLSVFAGNAVEDQGWIALLASDDYAEREEAVKALEARGLDALPALRAARQHPDPEARRRISELLDRLEIQAVSRRILQPRRIVLNLGDTTVSRAVAELSRQIGAPILIKGDRAALDQRRIKANLDATFWEALEQICREGGLRELPTLPASWPQGRTNNKEGMDLVLDLDALVQSPLSDRPIQLEVGPQPDYPTSQVGALRIRGLPTREGAPRFVWRDSGLLAFNLEVKPEPTLDWQSLLQVRIDRAVDEHGQILEPAGGFLGSNFSLYPDDEEFVLLSPRNRLELPMNSGYRQVPLALRPGPLRSRRLSELHGAVAARVRPAAEQLVVAENILQARGQTFVGSDGALLKVTGVSAEEDVYELKLDLTPPAPIIDLPVPPFKILTLNPETGRSIMTAQERAESFSLLDARGERLPLATGQYSYNGGGTMKLFTLTFVATKTSGPPVKLIYSGRRSVVIETPFVLRDVPLGSL
jgi:hypothetical protein